MPRALRPAAVAFAALLAVFAGAAPAQQQNPPPDLAGLRESFSDFLDVQAVHVDVVVTDAEGNRVQGLAAADFRLLVEGEEVAIESFQEVRDREVVSASAGIPEDQAIGNSYLIFIDEIYSSYRLRDEALQGIAKDLQTFDPQDQVAIVAVNRERVEILSPWTRSGPALDDLLKRMIRHTGSLANSGLRLERPDAAAGRRLEEAYQNHLDRLFAEQAGVLGVTSNAQKEMEPIDRLMAAATSTLRAFSGVPGRKIMLLLSGGWMTPPKPLKVWGQDPRSVSILQLLVDNASRLGFTVYPVYLVWVVNPYGLGPLIAGIRHGSLSFTAAETGGKLLSPGRNRHLGKVVLDTSAYYRLGFTFTGDDRRRDLQVEVRRPGLRVRSPESFVPLSRQTFVTQQVDSALLHGALTGMPPLTATAGELRKTADGRAELPVTVKIPVNDMTLLEQVGRRVGQLELRIAALADDGSRTVTTAIPIWLLREDDTPPGEVLSHSVTIQVEHKPQHVQLVLVDVVSGKAFAGQVRVEPKKM